MSSCSIVVRLWPALSLAIDVHSAIDLQFCHDRRFVSPWMQEQATAGFGRCVMTSATAELHVFVNKVNCLGMEAWVSHVHSHVVGHCGHIDTHLTLRRSTAMLGIERVGGVIVWCCLVVVNWFNAQFLHPIANWWLDSVLGTWEESTKSLLREFCAQSVRGLDLVVNALFGWFPGFQSTKTTSERPSAWQAWWAEDRQSTFNAIIERSGRGGAQGPSDQPVRKGASSKALAALCNIACCNPSNKHVLKFCEPADYKQPTSNGNQSTAGRRCWWSWRKQKGNTAKKIDNSVHQPSTDNSAPQKKRKPNAEQSKHAKRIPAHKNIKRNGSDLFDRPAGKLAGMLRTTL